MLVQWKWLMASSIFGFVLPGCFCLKSPVLSFQLFFFKLLEILLSQKSSYFVTHGKFYSWKVFAEKLFNENVSGYGNHIYAYTVRYRQLQYTKLLHTSKQLDRFNWNLIYIFGEMILQMKQKTKFWKIGSCTSKMFIVISSFKARSELVYF